MAQSGAATGTLRGGVRDANEGGRLPGVRVVATELRTGYVRSQVTTADGTYQFRLLTPGLYSVRAEQPGYAPFEGREVPVRLGSDTALWIELRLLSVADEVVVRSSAQGIEVERTSLVDTVDSGQLETVPLNGRNFRDLVLLSPQVVQTGRGTFGGGGHENSMSSFNIDGADANSQFFGDQRGGAGAAFTHSQEAIQEFQVLRSSYNVRFGGASGPIVNVVTRTGENVFAGGAHFFYQDDSLVATDALGNESSAFDRRQAGARLGGPFRRDVAHFFVAFDSQRRADDFPRAPTGLDPDIRPLFDARLPEIGLDPITEYDYVTTSDTDVLTLRFDWSMSERHRLSVQDSWLQQAGENATWGGFTVVGLSSNGSVGSSFNSAVASLASVLGSSTFNEVSLQFSGERRLQGANTTALPWTIIGSFDTLLGQFGAVPNVTDEDRLELQDHVTLQRLGHTVRAGFDAATLEFRNVFCLFCGGRYIFPTYESFIGGSPVVYTQAFSPVDGQIRYRSRLLSLYAGDQWQVSPTLTPELGLRLQHQENPTPAIVNPLEPRTGFIPDDTDLAPRFGFAWDVRGNGRAVLRGGVGLFHNWTPSLLSASVLGGNGINVKTIQLYSDHPLMPRYPDRLPPEFVALPGLPSDINLFAPDFENPETVRTSLGYERELRGGFRVGAEAIYSKSRYRERLWDVNLDPTPIGYAPDGRPIYGGSQARLDPAFGQKNQFTSDARAEYFATTLTFVKRFGGRFAVQVHYSYSESRDHDSVEFDQITIAPEDHYNLDQDWGPFASDIRHRVILSGSYTAPLGFTLSFFGRYRSAVPLNPLAASEDLNNDGFYLDRPGPDPRLGLDRHLGRNSFRQADWWHLDLRLGKVFRVAGSQELELLIEAFNVTNAETLVSFDGDYTRSGEINENFLQPQQDFIPRSFQLGLRYRF